MAKWDQRNEQLRQAAAEEHFFRYGEIDIQVDPDVFSPAVGYSSTMIADLLMTCTGTSALDMGTGTLLLALVLRLAGFTRVVAVDNHSPALACARKNLSRNARLQPIDIRFSDLFGNLVDAEAFDLIVFNQPYYPIAGAPIAGLGSDGGERHHPKISRPRTKSFGE